MLVSAPYPLWASPPVSGSRRGQGTVSAGTDAETPGAQGDNRPLPVPERGRGPGPSALQRAGLPEARGHPGAAQPAGEEDRAAQIGAGHTGPPWAHIAEMARPPPSTWTPVRGDDGGVLPLCQSVFRVHAHRWPGVPPMAGSSVWYPASEASHGGGGRFPSSRVTFRY